MKRGYFFTLDAFVALGIIISGFIILYSYHSQSIPSEQAHSDANNLLLLLTTTKINELNNNYISRLLINGTIKNPSNTIIEQLGEFYYLNETQTAKRFLEEVVKGYNMPQYGVAFLIENHIIYEKPGIPNLKNNILTSRNIVSGVYNATNFWGPYRTEVRVYQ